MSHQILITGANRGLGLEFVKQYALEGAQILACSRTPSEELKALAHAHANVELFTLDVGDFDQIDALAKQLRERPIDILINNAGIYPPSSLESVDYAAWERAFKINCMSSLKLAQVFLSHLSRGQLRKLVAITSKMGSIDDNTSGGEYIYRSSKTALNMVIKSLAIDLQPYGISVAALHPGWVRTDMGGPNGLIDPETSINGLRKVIANLDAQHSGQFIAYNGQPILW